MHVAGRNRNHVAGRSSHDHAARVIDGVEDTGHRGIAGMDSYRLSESRRERQPAPPDFAEAAPLVPDAPAIGPAVRQSRKSCSALVSTPSALSEIAGVGVPSGAATTFVPMPTTTASPSPGIASASSSIPVSFACPASTSLGHFSENRSERRTGHDPKCCLQRKARRKAERCRDRRRHLDSLKDAAGEIAPRRDPRAVPPPASAVCSVVTNHIGPRSPARACAMASEFVEPI